ncbi:unnamed protein product [Mytilus edulis]|uniref:DZIP3-like HEPN domain-containing protein n=1 Tax=Mytilus edulis TaxID=6550 RepID=A0A8S3PWV9_MYTED|nr:unnamed protein product [Mytilus edulis]
MLEKLQWLALFQKNQQSPCKNDDCCSYSSLGNLSVMTIDKSLSYKILRYVCPLLISVNAISEIRNEIAHNQSGELSDMDLQTIWEKCKENILIIANNTDSVREFKDEIDMAKDRWIDTAATNKLLATLHEYRLGSEDHRKELEGINHAINELGSGQTNIIERLKIIDERLESKEAERNDQTNCEIIKKQKDDEFKKHEEYKEYKRTLETDEQNIKKREELLEKEKEQMHNHEQQMMKLLGRRNEVFDGCKKNGTGVTISQEISQRKALFKIHRKRSKKADNSGNALDFLEDEENATEPDAVDG